MALSPFTFLRGAAGVMARDLAGTPVSGLRVQLCGDAHLANFGVYGTPERHAVFDANDFDETLPGPFEWDVKRLATSVVVVGRLHGFPRGAQRDAARRTVRAYRRAMELLAGERYLDAWYHRIELPDGTGPWGRPGRKILARAESRARRRTGLHAFPRLTHSVRGRYRIRDDPPLIEHYADPVDVQASQEFYESYLGTLPEERRCLLERYRIADVAQKVVGVGSVGTVCSVVLLLADPDVEDPLFLQIKEAGASVHEPYAGPSVYPNHAQRVVIGQRLVQGTSDIFLGWSSLRSRDFYVRQLRDMKLAVDAAAEGPRALAGQAELCGAALARAHARTGDPARISGYLGRRPVFDAAIARFAEAYADQTELDHAALRSAIRSGSVHAELDR
jgi:uncharacterized protein (DUF2252 family)